MLVPLYGFLEGDTMGLLVLAHADDTLAQVAARLSASASLRVEPAALYEVVARGVVLDARATVASVGLTALDRIDVRRKSEGEHAAPAAGS
jgi:hypothetical protein